MTGIQVQRGNVPGDLRGRGRGGGEGRADRVRDGVLPIAVDPFDDLHQDRVGLARRVAVERLEDRLLVRVVLRVARFAVAAGVGEDQVSAGAGVILRRQFSGASAAVGVEVVYFILVRIRGARRDVGETENFPNGVVVVPRAELDRRIVVGDRVRIGEAQHRVLNLPENGVGLVEPAEFRQELNLEIRHLGRKACVALFDLRDRAKTVFVAVEPQVAVGLVAERLLNKGAVGRVVFVGADELIHQTDRPFVIFLQHFQVGALDRGAFGVGITRIHREAAELLVGAGVVPRAAVGGGLLDEADVAPRPVRELVQTGLEILLRFGVMTDIRFAHPGVVVGVLQVFAVRELGDELFKARDRVAEVHQTEVGIRVLQKRLAVDVFVPPPFPLLDDVVEMVASLDAVGGVDVAAAHQVGVAQKELGVVSFCRARIPFDEIFEGVDDVVPRLGLLRTVCRERRRLKVEVISRLVLGLFGLSVKAPRRLGEAGEKRGKPRGRKEQKDPQQRKTDLAGPFQKKAPAPVRKSHRNFLRFLNFDS